VRIEKVFSATQSFGVSEFRMLNEYCRVLNAKYHHRDGRFRGSKIRNLLRLPVVGDPKIFLSQPAQHVAILVRHYRIHIH
jgi:hypothetical protein